MHALAGNRNVTLLALLTRCLGTRVQAKGGLGGECVDWANIYLANVWGQTAIQRNASDWATVEVNGFAWTANGLSNYPPAGSLVVWGQSAAAETGPNGHIAVALPADSMHLLTCDQNWPEGRPVSIVQHTYAGVLGWQTPLE